MKEGDTVRVTDEDLAKYLRRKGWSEKGTIVHKYGGYHYFRPHGASEDNIFELYSNELELLGE